MGAAAKLPKKPGIQKLTPLSSAAAIVGALMSTPRTKTNCLSLEHVIPRPPNNWESRHRIKGVRVALANSVAREGGLWRKCHIALRSTQAMQLGTSSREPLAQFGHLVLQPALGSHQFGAALADGEPVTHEKWQEHLRPHRRDAFWASRSLRPWRPGGG